MADSKALKMGDVVRLKSGGPKMTIANVSEPRPGPLPPAKWVRCIWFEGSNIFEYSFDSSCLVKVSEKAGSTKKPSKTKTVSR